MPFCLCEWFSVVDLGLESWFISAFFDNLFLIGVLVSLLATLDLWGSPCFPLHKPKVSPLAKLFVYYELYVVKQMRVHK